ncbi:hypothetical protein L1887_10857 [Cichorium endivia]|nr:hypothetical protein L1887_10857 [Cichorium endivia]
MKSEMGSFTYEMDGVSCTMSWLLLEKMEELVWRQALETVVVAPSGSHFQILRLAIGILEMGVAGAKGHGSKWW